ncbi:uncharacterized protein LOC135501700 [Lineus longissimus]|uniref:uncharacterized protein LOC135501700 n=1 Tax=Lineus longissimus TaxID=88925 RepID=UPI00315C81FB
MTSDITKAFLQIAVNKEDQDVHRFLWTKDGKDRVMKFLGVPFGNTASPFLLNATIRHHLSQYSDSETSTAVEELKENLYVDDWITGADYEDETCELFRNGQKILKEGSLSLAKCNSNNEVIKDMFRHEFDSHSGTVSTKILGLKWLKTEDCFAFDGVDIPTQIVTTKRVVLSFIARLFDPFGFLSPYIMYLKILLQEIWLLKLDWDDNVPAPLHDRFKRWVQGLTEVQQWRIPRRYGLSLWSNLTGVEVHGFGDASEQGYGAVVYLRIPCSDGSYEVSLVTSRARVTPVKKVSLPRLELLGALLCARVVSFVLKALKLPSDTMCRYWTDSTVALGWIKGKHSRWKTFVANRVLEIQERTDVEQWSHCPGRGNPADIMTRGVLAGELVSSKQWLSGPSWLAGSLVLGKDKVMFDQVERFLQPETVAIVNVARVWLPEDVLKVERWGTLEKAIRITAWVVRVLQNMDKTKQHVSGKLSLQECATAKQILLKHVQSVAYSAEIEALKQGKSVGKSSPLLKLNPAIGKDGLVRIGGRLENSQLTYAEKHPVIVPKGRLATLLIRSEHFRAKHAGVEAMITTIRDNYCPFPYKKWPFC